MTDEIFNDKALTKKVNNVLDNIRFIDIDRGLDFIESTKNSLYTVQSREKGILSIKVDKKKNIYTCMDSIVSDISECIGVDTDTLKIIVNIFSLGSTIYVSKKY